MSTKVYSSVFDLLNNVNHSESESGPMALFFINKLAYPEFVKATLKREQESGGFPARKTFLISGFSAVTEV